MTFAPGWTRPGLPSAPDNGGESPRVREIGDAPDLTRTMRSEVTGPTIIASWSSLEVFANQFKGDHGQNWWAKRNVRNTWHQEFCGGVESFDAALDLAIHGWVEGGETIERTRGYVRALNPLSPKLVKYGIAGSSPNIARAIAGNILNMRLPEKKKATKKKTITIVYNMCENGGVSAEAITNKAAVTAALVDEIEAKGFSVEVVSAVATRGWTGGEGYLTAYEYVRIKESHHPIDINRIAFGLGHAAMFRGLFFADMQRHDVFKPIGEGLGCAITTQPTAELCEQQIYTITSTSKGISSDLFEDVDKSVTDGLNAIVRALQKQGCPAFPPLKDHEDGLDEEPQEEDEPDNHYSYDW